MDAVIQNDSTPLPRAVRKIIHTMKVGLIRMRETMMDTRDLDQKGLKLRREMLGNEAVDKRMNAFGAFGEPLQHIINAYAYGDVWSRPALPMVTKSLAMVAMMAAAGRANELRVHIKGAIGNGATAEQIQDILLLVAMYCGIPAANEAHRIAVDVLREGQAAE
jgi:4-carboxymuconolactone decarboxylase